jgi:hypothetical protein
MKLLVYLEPHKSPSTRRRQLVGPQYSATVSDDVSVILLQATIELA